MITCAGIVSRSAGHYHYYWDFDSISLDAMVWTGFFIAWRFDLDLLLRQSGSDHFHLIGLNPLSLSGVVSAQRGTPTARDDEYKCLDELLASAPRFGTGNTLRVGPKGRRPAPVTLCTIWMGVQPVCGDYLRTFGILSVPSGTSIRNNCRPTWTLYQTVPTHKELEPKEVPAHG
jgi:hypothetical protein